MAVDWDGLVLAPCMEVFGETAVYTAAAAGFGDFAFGESGFGSTAPFEITGVFDEAYREVDLLDGPGITTAMPVLGIRLAEFSSPPAQGDQLIVRGQTFVVREVRPDGHGGAKLMLNLAS